MTPDLRAVSSELPDPPYGPETKIHGWRFQLDSERIRQSDTWALTPADMRPWLLMLWLTSWDQIPAGSFTDDDELIAARIGMDQRIFSGNRRYLMRGWRKHADGRLYHDVIAAQVLDHIEYRSKQSQRKREYRDRIKNVPGMSQGTDAGRARDSQGTDDNQNQNQNQNLNQNHNLSGEEQILNTESCRAKAATSPKKLPPMEDVEQILEHLNARTGQNFRARNHKREPTKNAQSVRERLAEYDMETCLRVIDKKVADWQGGEMEQYLRPGTLFRREKFEQYAGQAAQPQRQYGDFLNDDDGNTGNVFEGNWSKA